MQTAPGPRLSCAHPQPPHHHRHPRSRLHWRVLPAAGLLCHLRTGPLALPAGEAAAEGPDIWSFSLSLLVFCFSRFTVALRRSALGSTCARATFWAADCGMAGPTCRAAAVAWRSLFLGPARAVPSRLDLAPAFAWHAPVEPSQQPTLLHLCAALLSLQARGTLRDAALVLQLVLHWYYTGTDTAPRAPPNSAARGRELPRACAPAPAGDCGHLPGRVQAQQQKGAARHA